MTKDNYVQYNLHIEVIKMNTTIRVSRETKSRLQELGVKGQTYEDIIIALYHQRNILAIHEICKDMDEWSPSTVIQVFDHIGYLIPETFTNYNEDGEFQDNWASKEDALKWAIEMAMDEDFVGHCREPSISEYITNVYCLLEEIPAPTWSMSLRMKNPFQSFPLNCK